MQQRINRSSLASRKTFHILSLADASTPALGSSNTISGFLFKKTMTQESLLLDPPDKLAARVWIEFRNLNTSTKAWKICSWCFGAETNKEFQMILDRLSFHENVVVNFFRVANLSFCRIYPKTETVPQSVIMIWGFGGCAFPCYIHTDKTENRILFNLHVKFLDHPFAHIRHGYSATVRGTDIPCVE